MVCQIYTLHSGCRALFISILEAASLPGISKMDEFGSETESDYTSYWRDWVSVFPICRYHEKFGRVLLRLVIVFTAAAAGPKDSGSSGTLMQQTERKVLTNSAAC